MKRQLANDLDWQRRMRAYQAAEVRVLELFFRRVGQFDYANWARELADAYERGYPPMLFRGLAEPEAE
jgi:hypothetical protein